MGVEKVTAIHALRARFSQLNIKTDVMLHEIIWIPSPGMQNWGFLYQMSHRRNQKKNSSLSPSARSWEYHSVKAGFKRKIRYNWEKKKQKKTGLHYLFIFGSLLSKPTLVLTIVAVCPFVWIITFDANCFSLWKHVWKLFNLALIVKVWLNKSRGSPRGHAVG